jgi:hypothetical protein
LLSIDLLGRAPPRLTHTIVDAMKLLEGDSAVGVSVAKEFGEEGAFFGEVSDADEGGD